MALLQHVTLGTRIRPAERCLVGRAPRCHLVLGDTAVSREHAVVFCDAGIWKVRDLSSGNGTWVNGQRIASVTALERGAVVCFGTEESAFRVVELGPPEVSATSAKTGRVASADARGLFLPDRARCEAFVSRHAGQWFVEQRGEVRQVADQESIALEDDAWTLTLTLGEEGIQAETAKLAAAQPRLSFKVSRDEEHIEMVLHLGDEQHALPHRSHAYLLLLLARARIEDQRCSSLSIAEHGWIDSKQLSDMLRLSPERINVLVFRARKHLQELDGELAQRIVERRPIQGQLRIGVAYLSVQPL